MLYSTIEVAFDGALAVVALARPERLNALNRDVFRELSAALDDVEGRAEIRCVILTGQGRAFCSGADLTQGGEADGAGRRSLRASLEGDYNPLILRLTRFPMPVIAVVNGPAAGAGANLALACDIVLAGRSAYLQQAFVRIGLMPDAGGTWFLPRAVGTKRALALMLTGDPVSAEEAERYGLVYRVFDDAVLMDEARQFARRLAQAPLQALQSIREAVLHGASALQDQLALEARLQEELGYTDDFAEGVAAFREKRAPAFASRIPRRDGG